MEINYKALSSLVNRKIGYGIVQPGDSVPNGVPVIKVFNILAGLKSIDSLDTTKAENAAKYSRTKLNGGELIVSVVGTVGRTAIVPMSFAGCNLVRATALVDIPDETIALWVKYYIDSPGGQLYIDTNLNTTVQPTLNIKSLDRNQIANFTYLDYNTNIDISDDPPSDYVGRYRSKLGEEGYRKSCAENALPENFENMAYPEFLEQRRKLMAQIVKKAYLKLCE